MQVAVEPAKAAGSLLHEFRAFVSRGTLVDMAVGVVAGEALSRLIGSLVRHVVMPALGYVLPNAVGYESWTVGTVAVGQFLADLLHFAVVAVVVFVVVAKVGAALTRRRHRQEVAAVEAAAKPSHARSSHAAPPADVVLLTEIRDLLRQQQHLLQQQQANQAKAAPPASPFGF